MKDAWGDLEHSLERSGFGSLQSSFLKHLPENRDLQKKMFFKITMPQSVFEVRDLRLKNKQLEYGKQIKAGNNNDEMLQDLALIHEYRAEMQVAMAAKQC